MLSRFISIAFIARDAREINNTFSFDFNKPEYPLGYSSSKKAVVIFPDKNFLLVNTLFTNGIFVETPFITNASNAEESLLHASFLSLP